MSKLDAISADFITSYSFSSNPKLIPITLKSGYSSLKSVRTITESTPPLSATIILSGLDSSTKLEMFFF